MDFEKLIHHLETFDPEVCDRLDTRRAAMSAFAGMGKRLSLAALPLGIAAMLNKAYGQTGSTAVINALQLALKAEYLEAELYTAAVNNSGLSMPADVATKLKYIAYEELLHVSSIRSIIVVLGARPDVPYTGPASSRPSGADYGIDITGGGGTMNGPFAAAFVSLDVFLAVAQAFEDAGVRAYKGQAGNVFSNKAILGAALGIHSVEARHAAYLRKVRADRGAEVSPWVSGTESGIPEPYRSALAPLYGAGTPASSYPSEANTMQAGIDIVSLGITTDQATEAFDEPLDGSTLVRFLTGQVNSSIQFIY